MGANTKIEWCDFTFNPWRGCQKVAAGCMNCYAESQSKRNPKTLGLWGPNGTRVVASEAMWRQPIKWNLYGCPQCKGHGVVADWVGTLAGDLEQSAKDCPTCEGLEYRHRVFCGSLCDVFEDWQGEIRGSSGGVMWDAPGLSWQEQMLPGRTDGIMRDGGGRRLTLDDVRARLFRLIDETPSLDWLLLTKRPENVRRLWPTMFYPTAGAHGGNFLSEIRLRCLKNVSLGVSIACQEDADRDVPELLKCRDLCAKTFLSIEPLIGPVDLDECWPGGMPSPGRGPYVPGVDWVIVGGESGPNARPCDISWIRSIVRQCREAEVPVFVKQIGSRPDGLRFRMDDKGKSFCEEHSFSHGKTTPMDPKGGDPAEWPEDVRVREAP